MEIRFQRVREQDDISRALQDRRLDPSILDGVSIRDLELVMAGTIGVPFERYVSSAINRAGLRPLVNTDTRFGSYRLQPTPLFGGVVVSSGHSTILEIDSLLRSTTDENKSIPMIVEAKSGKPHNAFSPGRMSNCIDVARGVAREVLNLDRFPGVALSVVTPARRFQFKMKTWEREIEERGGKMIRAGFTIGDFHKELISLLRTRVR